MYKQMAKMGLQALALCVLFLDGTGVFTDPKVTAVDPAGIAVSSGLGSLVLLISSPFWILWRRLAPLWFAYLCGMAVICVVMYGNCYANLLTDGAVPHRPSAMTVLATIWKHPLDSGFGLVYCVVLVVLAAFQKRRQQVPWTEVQG